MVEKRETLFDKCNAGDYIMMPEFEMAFKVVSGKYCAKKGFPVADLRATAMECYWSNPMLKTQFKKDQFKSIIFTEKCCIACNVCRRA